MGIAMWMIELATKTITAESRMGSPKDMIGTTVPPCESAFGKHVPFWIRQSLPRSAGLVNLLTIRGCGCGVVGQAFFRPLRRFRYHWIRIMRGPLHGGQKSLITAVTDCGQRISAQTGALGAL